MQSIDPTKRALLLLVCPPLGSERLDAARKLLDQGVDLERLFDLAIRGGVAGAVAASLEQIGAGRVSARIARLFVACGMQAAAENRRFMAEARRLVLAGRERGLTLIPIKGISLLMDRPYRDPSLRTLVDIDFLIPRGQYAEAEALLLAEGYYAEPRREHALRHEHHVRFFNGETAAHQRLMVELHWTPFYTLYGAPERDEAPLQRLVWHEHDGSRLQLLDLPDTLLVLLSHLAHHRFRGQLKWAVDVAALVEQLGDRVDWPSFWARARELGAATGMAYGLWFVGQLFGIDVGIARAPRISPIARTVLPRLSRFEHLVMGDAQPPVWQRTIIDVALQDRLLDGMRYLLYKIPELLERETSTDVPDRLVRGGPEASS